MREKERGTLTFSGRLNVSPCVANVELLPAPDILTLGWTRQKKKIVLHGIFFLKEITISRLLITIQHKEAHEDVGGL